MSEPVNPARLITLSEETSRQALEAHALLKWAVRPLCVVAERGQPEFWGSGVLLKLASEHFLATAAHVIHEVADQLVPHGVRPGMLVTFGSERHVALHGRVHRTLPPDGASESEDLVDAALLELSAADASEIDDAHFLTTQDIDVRDHLAPPKRYFLLGFPANWQKRDLPAASMKTKLYPGMGQELPPAAYEVLGYPRLRNLAVGFDRRKTKVDGKFEQSPDPRGTSGGGWWRVDQRFGPLTADSSVKLVAIMSKHYPGKEKAMLATRISVFIQLLSAARPELSDQLPDVSWLPKLERWCTLPGPFHTLRDAAAR